MRWQIEVAKRATRKGGEKGNPDVLPLRPCRLVWIPGAMVVRLRLQRFGRHNRPFYRIVAADSRAKRDGRFIERVSNTQAWVVKDKSLVTSHQPSAEFNDPNLRFPAPGDGSSPPAAVHVVVGLPLGPLCRWARTTRFQHVMG
jgi:hypothetical protein